MKIHSERFATDFELDDAKIISMPLGLPGFPESKRFYILDLKATDSSFKWLHDVDHTAIALLITNPYTFFLNYNPKIKPEILGELAVQNFLEEMMIFTVVQVSPGGAEAYTNLRAPILVNVLTRVARQVILEDDEYAIKTALFVQKQQKVTPQKKAAG
jgi:flagellar assembly factor FliW